MPNILQPDDERARSNSNQEIQGLYRYTAIVNYSFRHLHGIVGYQYSNVTTKAESLPEAVSDNSNGLRLIKDLPSAQLLKAMTDPVFNDHTPKDPHFEGVVIDDTLLKNARALVDESYKSGEAS